MSAATVCPVDPQGFHYFGMNLNGTRVCGACGQPAAAAATTAGPHPTAPLPSVYYNGKPLASSVMLPPAPGYAAARVHFNLYDPPAPKFDFGEVKAQAMEEKCPGAGFSAEGHQAKQGTAELVDPGVVQVFCNKCRTKVIVYLKVDDTPASYGDQYSTV